MTNQATPLVKSTSNGQRHDASMSAGDRRCSPAAEDEGEVERDALINDYSYLLGAAGAGGGT